ncbi:hypothetical protein JOM56_007705 [Amanita muscaria]
MHLITGAQLFHLVRFSFACADAACSTLTTDPFESYGFGKWSHWKRLRSFDVKVPDVMYQQLKTCPRGSTILDVYDRGLSQRIPETTEDDTFDFLRILQCMKDTPKVVEEAVSKVDLSNPDGFSPVTEDDVDGTAAVPTCKFFIVPPLWLSSPPLTPPGECLEWWSTSQADDEAEASAGLLGLFEVDTGEGILRGAGRLRAFPFTPLGDGSVGVERIEQHDAGDGQD